MPEKHHALRQVYRFDGFTEAELQQLFAAHELVNFSKGDFLLKEGKMPNEYFILEKGVIRSFVYDYNGSDITINFFVENSVVLEPASLFQRTRSKENIEALTDCVCWKIQFEKFQALYHSIKNFSEWGRAWMSGKLFECRQRSVEMITERASERYLKLVETMPTVLQFAPLKNIATYLGVTDTSLSRIRKGLAS